MSHTGGRCNGRRNYGKAARPLLPPGPVGVPLLGYLPFLDVLDLGGSFSRLSRKYGDVFSLKVGTESAVVLGSYDAIKAVLGDSRFDSRPNTLMFKVGREESETSFANAMSVLLPCKLC